MAGLLGGGAGSSGGDNSVPFAQGARIRQERLQKISELRKLQGAVLNAEQQFQAEKMEALSRRISPEARRYIEPEMCNLTLPEVKEKILTKIATEINNLEKHEKQGSWEHVVHRNVLRDMSDDEWLTVKRRLNDAVQAVLTPYESSDEQPQQKHFRSDRITTPQMQRDAEAFAAATGLVRALDAEGTA